MSTIRLPELHALDAANLHLIYNVTISVVDVSGLRFDFMFIGHCFSKETLIYFR